VVAGQREDASAADTAKRTSDNVGAAQGVAHRLGWTFNSEFTLMSSNEPAITTRGGGFPR
jgi:hypothetical protein